MSPQNSPQSSTKTHPKTHPKTTPKLTLNLSQKLTQLYSSPAPDIRLGSRTTEPGALRLFLRLLQHTDHGGSSLPEIWGQGDIWGRTVGELAGVAGHALGDRAELLSTDCLQSDTGTCTG